MKRRRQNDSCDSRPRKKKKRRVSDRSSRSDSEEASIDEEEGSVKVRSGDLLREKRYKVLGVAGKGTFGTVLEVFDYKYKEKIALKVVRSVPRYLDAAHVEVDILEKIRKKSKNVTSLCVKLLGAFTTRIRNKKHVCIAFERLGSSVYEFIKANKYKGFTENQVCQIGYQLVHAVSFMHQMKLTHTDLKPENILLVNDDFDLSKEKPGYRVAQDVAVRVIDFGGATFAGDHHSQMINTRQYRAPEVILGLGWDEKSDIWSIGCIMAELFTGELLFGTHEDIEHLALMEKILGNKLPKHMIKKAFRRYDAKKSSSFSKTKKRRRKNRSPSSITLEEIFTSEKWTLSWPKNASSYSSRRLVQKTLPLEGLIPCSGLTECIRKCLVYDPRDRISAKELCEIDYFTENCPQQLLELSQFRR